MKNTTLKLTVSAVLSAAMIGCGGSGGSGGSSGEAGRFSDSVVEGLNYATTSGRSGVTNRDGVYRFNDGDMVTFSVGSIELGTAPATKATLFPKDIAKAGKAANIAQLLQSLDKDNNPDNGIDLLDIGEVSEELTTKINNVFEGDTVDFVAADIEALHESATFVTKAAATAHVEETLRCEYAGGYAGSIVGSNTDTDDFGVIVHADGTAQMVIQDEDGSIELTRASEVIDFANTLTFVIVPKPMATNTITFVDVNNLSGTTAYKETVDNLTASRIGGSIDAEYRFTGAFIGDDHGLFTFDIDDKNDITGIAYSVEEDKSYTLTGALTDGTTLTVKSSGGATVTATVNLATGTLSNGMWIASKTEDGTFTGSGCNLNPQTYAPVDKAAFAAAFSHIDFVSGVTRGYDISANELTETFGERVAYPYTYTVSDSGVAIIVINDAHEHRLSFTSALGGTDVELFRGEPRGNISFTLTPRPAPAPAPAPAPSSGSAPADKAAFAAAFSRIEFGSGETFGYDISVESKLTVRGSQRDYTYAVSNGVAIIVISGISGPNEYRLTFTSGTAGTAGEYSGATLGETFPFTLTPR